MWTPAALAYLRKHWRNAAIREEVCKTLIGMGIAPSKTARGNVTAIAKRAWVEGLLVKFTKAEDALIRKLYPKRKLAKLVAEMGDRHTHNEIKARARLLLRGTLRSKRHWTVEEDRRLAEVWDQHYNPRSLGKMFPGRTMLALYLRGTRDLELPTGMSQGYSSIEELSRKYGYSWYKTERVLRAVGVTIHTANRLSMRRLRMTAVETDDALEALVAYEQRASACMTLKEAAVALGVGVKWLSLRIRKDKIQVPRTGYSMQIDANLLETLRGLKRATHVRV